MALNLIHSNKGKTMSAAWIRVFSSNENEPDKADFATEAMRLVHESRVTFHSVVSGWFWVDVALGDSTPLKIIREGCDEPEVREDIHGWVAYLETCDHSHHAPMAMEKVAFCRQVFTLRRPINHPDEAALDRLMEGLARHLAHATDGLYQVDGRGFFDKSGTLLVEEY